MTPPGDVDVCVMGGGPAGSTIGRQLAQGGYHVCLIEKARFPRPHVGESLPPSILPLLESLGLVATIEHAGFLRTHRVLLHWATVQRVDPAPDTPRGFQVDRGRFDQLLLNAARQAGVRVLLPASTRRAICTQDGTWQIRIATEGNAYLMRARFLVDAAGKSGYLRGERQRTAPATLALFAYWNGVPCDGPETRVEDGADGWYWGAPLPDGTFNATVFLDPERYREAGQGGLEALYRSRLTESRLLRDCLRGHLVAPVRCCDATCYAVPAPAGNNWIKVGEASFSIDPLSSQGVQTAISTAVQAAAVVNTLLRRPDNAAVAIDFYRARQAELIAHHHDFAAESYALQQSHYDTLFWRRRATVPERKRSQYSSGRQSAASQAPLDLHAQIRLAHSVRVVETGVLHNGQIEQVPALVAPHWERPVAFVHNISVGPLADTLRRVRPVWQILSLWSNILPWDHCQIILAWMWQSNLLEKVV